MAEEIINRVARSALVTFDLERYYPEGERRVIDIADWLFENCILKEKDFRASLATHSWEQYQDAFVALHCSTDAIIPAWAYMLITTYVSPYAKRVVLGGREALETALYQAVLEEINLSEYANKAVIIKGCSHKPVPPAAYVLATAKLQPVAKSLFYGEACSSVPLFKRK